MPFSLAFNTTLYLFYAVTHSDTESGISGWSDVCEISETTDSSKLCMHLLGMEMAVHGILQSRTCSVSMQETALP